MASATANRAKTGRRGRTPEGKKENRAAMYTVACSNASGSDCKTSCPLCAGEGVRYLLVPSPGMARLHEGSRPTAICERAGLLPDKSWYRWRRQYSGSHPWILGLGEDGSAWIFGDDPPSKIHIPVKVTSSPHVPDDRMFRFRAEATQTALVTAASSTGCASNAMVRRWLRNFGHLPWFRPWLLRGEEPPSNVFVASQRLIDRCRQAWHYRKHLTQADAGANDPKTYIRWIKQLPEVWGAFWLFGGGTPEEWFVVSESLLRLRHESLEHTICERLGISHNGPRRWRSCPRLKARLDWEIKNTEHGGKLEVPDGLPRVSPKAPPVMKRFAEELKLAARLLRVDLSHSTYSTQIARGAAESEEVSRNGCKAKRSDIKAFLDGALQTQTGHDLSQRRAGIIAPYIFAPTEQMLRFRREAAKAMAEGFAWKLTDEVPAFQEWMLDEITPSSSKKRSFLGGIPEEAAAKSDEQLSVLRVDRLEAGVLVHPGSSATPAPKPPKKKKRRREAKASKPYRANNSLEVASRQDDRLLPAVVLERDGGAVHVFGKDMPALTARQYDCVKTLLNSYPSGITKDEFARKSGHQTNARHILMRLRSKDPDWEAAVVFPGRTAGRYKIAPISR